jgi:CRP-like cAMP-binding protein
MLVASCNLLKLTEGTDIIKEGEKAECFYVIVHGNVLVKILPKDEEGKTVTGDPVVVAKLRGGQYFGELALLSDEPRLATVTVESNYCVLLEFGRTAFRKTILDTPVAGVFVCVYMKRGR